MHALAFAVATCIASVVTLGDPPPSGRILATYVGAAEEFYPDMYVPADPEGGNDVEGTTMSASRSQTDAVQELRIILQDRYISHPLAVVVDIEETSLDRAKRLWDAALQNVHDPDVALTLLPYNASGLGPVFKTRSVSWFLQALHYLHADPQADASVAFYSLLKATEQVSVDSAIILFTARQAVDEYLGQLAASTLQQKRSKLFVFWCGPEPTQDGGKLFRELAVMTGGKFYVAYPNEPAVTNQRPHDDGRKDTTNEVTLAVRKGVMGSIMLPLNVDSTVNAMHITIAGPIKRAVLKTPTGDSIDLLSPEMTSRRWSSAGVRVITKTDELTELQVNTSASPPGTWQLGTTGGRYNVTITAASRLSFTASIRIQDKEGNHGDGDNSQLRLTLVGVGDIANVVLVDETGKELKRLAYHRRDGFAPGPNGQTTTDLDLPNIQSTSPIYVKLSGQDHTGAEFTRLSPLERQFQVGLPPIGGILPPVTIELAANSTLNVLPNYWAHLVFEVTNNLNTPMRYYFVARDEKGFVRNVQPTQFILGPLLTVNVAVNAIAPAMTPHGTIDTITLTVQMAPMLNEPIRKSAMITIGDKISDHERPKIWHTVKTDCEYFLSPSTCQSSVWSTEITIEDRHSGLLRVTSVPRGIQFRTEFISGTKSAIIAYYSATCCNTKVDITATDVEGNFRRYYINGDNTFYGLEKGETAAVVLGVILLVALIAIIVLTVCICKNRRSRELPVRPRSTH